MVDVGRGAGVFVPVGTALVDVQATSHTRQTRYVRFFLMKLSGGQFE
jgi:hypothetical protein